ncbi:MAG TPA: DUF1553 domain-containing protein, partial [Vicinamibacterales bacterium]|nr:DUF1553 domain-containing protein [Vicinamibacterales bacterium]
AVLGACLAAPAAALLLQAACGSPRAPQVEGLPDRVDFNAHVKPILSDRCFACHGPDDRARKADLRLDIQESALSRLPSGKRAVVPGSPRRSELVRRILSSDPAVMMPAPESHLTLSDYEKALLVRWIEQGAEWKPHWAFIPPVRPEVPALPGRPKAALGGSRAGNEIDAFILAALQARGLEPAPEASKETLIRRVTLDLTGLPPTLEEIDAFLADTSPDAYEKVVDRLLASPAYGERMAADWLDVARYADSHGYQDDGMREMWPWRDWVIDAFNRNLPFDQFIVWQLAGDLLPGATDEQRLATGFNRNHMQSQEGGIVPEEYRTEYVVDRVNTLGRAFLGISVECARCHDHKYDPITQSEFYRLYAFFNSVNEAGQIPYAGVPSPSLIVMDDATKARLASLRERMRALEAELVPSHPRYDDGFVRWLSDAARVRRVAAASPPGLIAHLPLDRSERAQLPRPPDPKTGIRPPPEDALVFENPANPRQRGKLGGDRDRVPETVPGRIGQAQRLVGDSHIEVGERLGLFERNQPFAFALWVRIEKTGASGPLVTRSSGIFNGNRGYEVILREDGTLTAGLHHVAPDNSIEIETVRPLSVGRWHSLAFTYDGSSRASGIRLFIDGKPAESRIVVDNLRRSILWAAKDPAAKEGVNWGEVPGLRIGRRHDETLQDVSVDDLRVFDRRLSALEIEALSGAPDPLARLLDVEPGQRTSAQAAVLREHYLLREDAAYARTAAALEALRGEENALLTSLPEVMVMRDLPKPRPTFVLARGAYDAPTEPVTPGTPAALGSFPSDLPPNRLGLARWLVDPKHPLTARVLVNRYWAMFFGRGLVATLADFGNQGRLPTHPELLDWLAVTFVESGWDLKGLVKRIVLSAAYRQSSAASPELRERDPANEWLARGPSFRLSAEQIRDSALAASGLLVRRIGGPSVYPYQPPGLWEALATRNATKYEQGKGDDLYRRSLYTVWKRSSPPPAATTFDAADRLFCIVNRQRTNTPLQALVLMNDVQFVEAARLLAERMMKEGGSTPRERLAFGFRLVTSRRPGETELAALERLYTQERRTFARDRAAAQKLLTAGERPRDPRLDAAEVASYSVVASTLFSLDEAVMRR